MNRREFLVVSLMGLGSLLLPHPMPSARAMGSLQPLAGRALDGLQRRVQAVLGSQYTILGIYQNQDGYLAKVSFEGLAFYLKSTDGAAWYTGEWEPPQVVAPLVVSAGAQPARHKTYLEASHG